jgi:cytochrome c oxidase subunit 1
MDFTGAALGFDYPGMAYTLMGIGAFGGVIGVIGGGAFLLITVGSLVFGKKLEPSAGLLQSFGVPLAASCYSNRRPETLQRAAPLPVEGHGSSSFEAPGTFVLALVLLVTFIVYYFINWKYLASVWPLS